MRLVIAPSEPTPIYRQIVDQVRRQIAGGQLSVGTELPSVRAVALEHTINPMTVSKAYSLLEAQGVLERRRGLGMLVAATAHNPARPAARQRERMALLEPALQAAAHQTAQLGLSAAEALAGFQRALAQHLDTAAPPDSPAQPPPTPSRAIR